MEFNRWGKAFSFDRWQNPLVYAQAHATFLQIETASLEVYVCK